ncbi:MAG: MerR family transcriptional regulator [Flavobacterium sp.]|nr:MerR family transcriptional regulator [Flavobacterium sp.]
MKKTVENKKTPLFTISTAADLLGISVHTLRMYERNGLIVPFKKDTKQRRYSRADIERIECIRKAINIDKISIEGIKKMLALIPCWKIIKCSKKEREKCEAYRNMEKPCWAYKLENNVCSSLNCTECEVYNTFVNCSSIKDFIKTL